MIESSAPSIRIDLNEFKLHIHFRSRTQLTLHFNSPSRRFYLSLIALVLSEMKRSEEIKSIPIAQHLTLLGLLNETVGEAAGSSERENLLHRIYTKWKDALPNLEEAPLFRVLGRKKEEGQGEVTGKAYSFKEADQDDWANLFQYIGSHENVRLKFAVDEIGMSLGKTSIVFSNSVNGEAWDRFISSLKRDEKKTAPPKRAPTEEHGVTQPPAVPWAPPREQKISWMNRYSRVLLAAAIGIAAVGMGAIYWSSTRTPVASLGKMKYPLPDKPSIAVLPFVNMSEDPKQEYFSDGITEEIITALSQLPNIFVIARNSTFTYKGKAVKVNQVAEELGVRYVLEGSVRKTGERVRIAAQLVDALTGHHLWAERYERDLKDIFALQDEITLKIITALQVKLTAGEQARLAAKGTTNLEAYIKAMQCREQLGRITKEGVDAAKQLAEEIVVLDPGYARGYVFLAGIHHIEMMIGLSESPQQSIAKSIELAEKAISLDNTLSYAYAMLGQGYTYARQYHKAIAAVERAVALDPNSAENLSRLAWVLDHVGRYEEAVPLVEDAARLNPFPPPVQINYMAQAYMMTGRYEKAIEAAEKALKAEPKYLFAHFYLIACYMELGREQEARAAADELLRIYPHYSFGSVINRRPYKDRAVNDRLIAVLSKAGLK
jgi:adenylate cyclase